MLFSPTLGSRSLKISDIRRWWAVRENNATVFFGVILLVALITPSSLKLKVWLCVIYAMILVVVWTHRWTVQLALAGHYDWALWLNQKIPQIPGHGPLLHAWILIEAGRYSEARSEITMHLAFDATGKPILTDFALYLQAIALLYERKESEAQNLLEEAVLIPQELCIFHFALADCLLAQRKDPQRAIDLIQIASSKGLASFRESEQRVMRAQINALLAWALALSGRRQEAEKKLQESLAQFDAMSLHDRAGVLHLKGVTLATLGKKESAMAAWQEALSIFPFGGTAKRSSEALAAFTQ